MYTSRYVIQLTAAFRLMRQRLMAGRRLNWIGQPGSKAWATPLNHFLLSPLHSVYRNVRRWRQAHDPLAPPVLGPNGQVLRRYLFTDGRNPPLDSDDGRRWLLRAQTEAWMRGQDHLYA